MNTPVLPPGKLRARLDIPSYRLSQNLPIEIRDSQLRLLGEVKNDEIVELQPGWYEVSAVLNDGQRHSETVRVTAGELQDVALVVAADTLMPKGIARFDSLVSRDDAPGVEFLGAEEARLEHSDPDRWIFLPENDHPNSMPVAHIKIGKDRLNVSLPVNPRGYDQHAACVMTFERHDHSVRVRAGFHPERIVSAAIHNMVERRQFAQANAAVEITAEDMLQSKYQDPVGAALGAIIMYRAGTLARRRAWLNNLQRDFDWLPDGKILLAALVSRSETELAADLLVRASTQRPLFTESFSILFGALREWRAKHRAKDVSAALQRVATQAKRIDWSAFTVTDRDE